MIDLNEDGVGHTLLDAFGQNLRVGHKKVIAHELHAAAQSIGQLLPTFPVDFSHTVFDRNDRILSHPAFQDLDPFFGGIGLALSLLDILAVFVEFACGAVQTDGNILTRFVARSLDGFNDQLDSFFVAVDIGSKTAFVTHSRAHAATVDDFL